MKAAFLEATGAPDVLKYGDVPSPAPQAGEIRIKVATAALNPIDTYIRAGVVKMQLPMPFI
ncbi:MAG: NADPH:quinone reductase, partial [Planctomycetes bacterium]|nr:NADPH:quinone reductase [Planctomycetota bacterium]